MPDPRIYVASLVALVAVAVTEVAVELPALGPESRSLGGYALRDGADEARRDIAAGRMTLKTYGLGNHRGTRYEELLKSEIGVEFDVIAGCVVDQGLIDYANAYNAEIERHVERQHGTDILERIWQRAVADYVQHGRL